MPARLGDPLASEIISSLPHPPCPRLINYIHRRIYLLCNMESSYSYLGFSGLTLMNVILAVTPRAATLGRITPWNVSVVLADGTLPAQRGGNRGQGGPGALLPQAGGLRGPRTPPLRQGPLVASWPLHSLPSPWGQQARGGQEVGSGWGRWGCGVASPVCGAWSPRASPESDGGGARMPVGKEGRKPGARLRAGGWVGVAWRRLGVHRPHQPPVVSAPRGAALHMAGPSPVTWVSQA